MTAVVVKRRLPAEAQLTWDIFQHQEMRMQQAGCAAAPAHGRCRDGVAVAPDAAAELPLRCSDG